MTRSMRMVLIVGLALLTISCTHMEPVLNISDEPISANRSASLEEIGNAIISAGNSVDMQMKRVSEGVIEGAYSTTRDRSATMEIKYTVDTYSITYKDSQGLDYDGARINSIYDRWVRKLRDRIRVYLDTL